MTTLYDEILAIAREYMGPAAEDYIQRRIRIVQHGQDPKLVKPDKLSRLAAGIDMTAKVYMSSSKAQRFKEQILALEKK